MYIELLQLSEITGKFFNTLDIFNGTLSNNNAILEIFFSEPYFIFDTYLEISVNYIHNI